MHVRRRFVFFSFLSFTSPKSEADVRPGSPLFPVGLKNDA